MPRIALLTAFLAVVVAAAPAAAGGRDRNDTRDYRDSHSYSERHKEARRKDAWQRRGANRETRKRWRYAQRRSPYAYPWMPWGPFPAPPGL